MPNLPLPGFLQPLPDVAPDDFVLQLHIGGQGFAREQRQEGLADGLVRRAVHERQVALSQNILA